MKICKTCNTEKSLEDFHLDRSDKTGRANKCKICAKKYSKQWYSKSEKYRESIRNSGLKFRFKITIEDYNQMYEEQRGLCKICGEKGKKKNLYVDHDHRTGEIRALLCDQCNYGLGNFKDSPELLIKAYDYILEYNR